MVSATQTLKIQYGDKRVTGWLLDRVVKKDFCLLS